MAIRLIGADGQPIIVSGGGSSTEFTVNDKTAVDGNITVTSADISTTTTDKTVQDLLDESVPDAPANGDLYVRRNNGWYPLPELVSAFENTYKPDKMLARTRNITYSGESGTYGIGMADTAPIMEISELDYRVSLTADTPATIVQYTDNGLFNYVKGQKIYIQLYVACQVEDGEKPFLTITAGDGTVIGESDQFGLEYCSLFGSLRVLQGYITINQTYATTATDVMSINLTSAITQNYSIRVGSRTFMSYIIYEPEVASVGESSDVRVIDKRFIITTSEAWLPFRGSLQYYTLNFQILLGDEIDLVGFKGMIIVTSTPFYVGDNFMGYDDEGEPLSEDTLNAMKELRVAFTDVWSYPGTDHQLEGIPNIGFKYESSGIELLRTVPVRLRFTIIPQDVPSFTVIWNP